MCVTFVYIDHRPGARYKLILINNRDEYFDRPTSEAKWESGILAGRDEKEKNMRGTWLCMDANGRIANLLVITIPYHERKLNAPSRGSIPLKFLRSNKRPGDFCASIVEECDSYNAFQVLCLQRNESDQYEMSLIANQFVESFRPIDFPPGIYGFGNSPVDRPFKKVQRGTGLMENIIEEINTEELCEEKIIARLLTVLNDRILCDPDEQLRKQLGRSREVCKYRTSLYVQYPDGIRYGTRSHSIILVDASNHATFYEKRMTEVPKRISDAVWAESVFHFDLNEL